MASDDHDPRTPIVAQVLTAVPIVSRAAYTRRTRTVRIDWRRMAIVSSTECFHGDAPSPESLRNGRSGSGALSTSVAGLAIVGALIVGAAAGQASGWSPLGSRVVLAVPTPKTPARSAQPRVAGSEPSPRPAAVAVRPVKRTEPAQARRAPVQLPAVAPSPAPVIESVDTGVSELAQRWSAASKEADR
jgi:hypothetical protein